MLLDSVEENPTGRTYRVEACSELKEGNMIYVSELGSKYPSVDILGKRYRCDCEDVDQSSP
jgi:hypothetical protein